MWLITKRGESVRELSAGERSLLFKYTESERLPPAELRSAADLLRQIRADEHWIVCDCAKPGPVLTVVLRDTGYLGLRNNQSSAPHAPACPWLKQESAGSDRQRSSSAADLERVDPKSALALHREFTGTKGAESSQISRSATSGTDRSLRKRLLSLLVTLLDAGGLLEYDPASPKSINDQYARIREAATRFKLGPQTSLSGYFSTHIAKKDLVMMAARLKASTTPGRKVGLLLDLIDSIKGREIEVRPDQAVPFFGHVEHEGKAAGPLLCLATVTTQQPGTRFYELGNVAYVPVLSRRNLLPVFSDRERTAINELTGLLDWMYAKHSRRVMLRRDILSAGHVIELVGRDRIVLVDLLGADLPLNGVVPEIEDQAVRLSLGDEPIDDFKRRVARLFLRDSE